MIIGAGAVGLASALELARRGARVTVLDRFRAGAESTWAGGGILSPLLPWQYGDEVNTLSEYSRANFADWCARLQAMSGLDAEYRTSGMLVLPPYSEAQAFDWCARHGWRCEKRGQSDFLPTSSMDGEEALWLPDVAQARNPRLVQVLRAAALAAGIRIVESAEVTGLISAQGRVTGVMSTQGEFAASGVVVSAGAWTGTVPGLEALAETVFPVRGQMLLFKLQPEALRTIVLQDGRYLIPRIDGHVLVGSTLERVGFEKSTTESVKRDLLAFSASVLPALSELVMVHHWSGLRPGSHDNVPVIARYPGYDNLFINSGHFRYGVTMAPGSALLLADLIEGKSPAISAAPYAQAMTGLFASL
ncbi:MAG: glycine oxidase ThiO [Hydrogenophilales bacterium 28-61-23]|nr:MAG: glycine oxidase ThiO [Hydrogenophilales bacterium 28-61-23]